jgi:DNA-binding response OmpR family regulator
MRILIAEDDEALAKFVRQGLEGEHYSVNVVSDGEQARAAALELAYDVVVLDLNLPKLDGVSVLRQLRLRKPSLPVLILTQRTKVEDRVRCLDTGADDYLAKPFSFSELSARIRALLRRSHLPSESVLVVGDLKLDRVQRIVERASKRIELTGLQCSLELASARPHAAEEYARTLQDALELTARMRVLVEALREIADSEYSEQTQQGPVLLNDLLSTQIEDLLPVSESIGVHVTAQIGAELCVSGNRALLCNVLFRLLDSVLSLARKGSNLQIVAEREKSSAFIRVCSVHGSVPEFSPYSRQELGLLIAQAGWEHAGGTWIQLKRETDHICELRLHLRQAISSTEGVRDAAEKGAAV